MDFGNQLEHFSLKWNNFNDNMKSGFHDLFRAEDFVDVTIAAEGKLIQAHKMVLSVCSPYFKNIFKANPCQHPVIFLKDVTHKELTGILQFMYLGEVSIQQEELGRFLKTAEALQIKGLTGDGDDCGDEPLNEAQENPKHPVKNKTKLVNNHDNKETSVKKMKLSSNDADKGSNHTPVVQNQSETLLNNDDHEPVVYKTEEAEYSDDESDRISIKEENMSDFLQYTENSSDIKEGSASSNTSNVSGHPADVLTGIQGIPNESYITESNQEIRFVLSPRMRPCLVYNNYLYIKDHVGVASPGQPKTIYWRCKDITCKARCIQTNFKFRLKRNTFHQHRPNVDPSYFPIHLEKAFDVIRYLNGPENSLNVQISN